MSERPAEVRFYVDQDLLGLAKILVQVRSDVTYPGDPGGVLHRQRRPASPIRAGARDVDWIPVVAERGWLVLSRDQQIQFTYAELTAVRDSGTRMVRLSGEAGKRKWTQLEAVMTQWRKIEQLLTEEGPLLVRATHTAFSQVDIESEIARLESGRRRPRG
ncbi:hypothetical protein G9U51_11455 [Calidifontibacter sp. DB0510]|uniref:VapC45 PIN like domain-containing protein n=1 Tax=Metallococcus carri TaxID=1656884 RepID=A0A967B155_9MICO|nr:hypothetical protein [Metallococcus carri]NHN56393.1 hypothetical protein [Metallococcus carri]NOP36017.1 hypothetical protein [Calidifontibacter sp. DB2511S]